MPFSCAGGQLTRGERVEIALIIRVWAKWVQWMKTGHFVCFLTLPGSSEEPILKWWKRLFHWVIGHTGWVLWAATSVTIRNNGGGMQGECRKMKGGGCRMDP